MLCLGATDLSVMMNFIDAAYSVHDDLKSHAGGASTFGHGVFSSMSSKQKLNMTSSTTAELVGVADYLPKASYFRNFMEGQGFEVKRNVILHDNQSAMLMEKKGRLSCSKRTRHLNVRYFCVKDVVERGEAEITCCPTQVMLADFFTTPLQGNIFRRFRAVILGHVPVYTLYQFDSSVSKERVEVHKMQPIKNQS